MFFFLSSAGLESPDVAPKKLDLTKENLALLGQDSFKQKTTSTFSRGSAQNSVGREGKRGNISKGKEREFSYLGCG